ncbi:MAG: response regulator transcription factor [Planctomycetes bacterium]|nr:response regulator transcription factor [Planctomycetota bacterium]
MRVLIVEDEPDLAQALVRTLRDEGFACDVAEDGDVGWHLARSWDYDAIVLDLMLPGLDGASLLRRLRKSKPTPVLVLTARDDLPTKVELFDNGADDYLTKPFELAELLARLRALIRRSVNEPAPILELGDVRVDTVRRRVERDGASIALTPKEYALLEFLALRRGSVVSRTSIFEHIYDETEDTRSNVLEVYVAKLRRKLGSDVIQTRRGEGYTIDG